MTHLPNLKCLTWNLEWATPSSKSKRTGLIQEAVRQVDPEVVCYTEINRTLISEGHWIESGCDYGYGEQAERRKVLLWSKCPWTAVDLVGDSSLPPGRFVSGITQGIRFVGVCIPWRDAHVRTGRRDRNAWEEHKLYCQGLKDILQRYSERKEPVCVLGDYNQRIPRVTQPREVAQALSDAIPSGFSVVTEGVQDSEGKNLIDHFTVSPGLKADVGPILPRIASDGTRLSDHVGVVTHITHINKGIHRRILHN